MHNNSLLKYLLGPTILLLVIYAFIRYGHQNNIKEDHSQTLAYKVNNTASNDSAAESLDTLTAEIASTKQQIVQVSKDNETLKNQNAELQSKVNAQELSTNSSMQSEVEQLKNEISSKQTQTANYDVNTASSTQAITTVSDLTQSPTSNKSNTLFNFSTNNSQNTNELPTITPTETSSNNNTKPIIPYYTIPANSTSVHDRLMTALVGRIPIKGVVTDPYPFKIVFSNDTLAANGLRVPHLTQMIVSGYSEGDLNLLSVRGWVTSLTFVFDDGTITNTTSNNNNIGQYTKENALGYLSDPHGNPFIQGKLITNAPSYLTGNILLGAAQGAANAYSQAQTTNQSSVLGTISSSVTGSSTKYVLGQSGVNAANEAQQWWSDREEQSFDAIYVPSGQEIVVNFAKEILIDYNPQGRKIVYENNLNQPNVNNSLD